MSYIKYVSSGTWHLEGPQEAGVMLMKSGTAAGHLLVAHAVPAGA